MPQGEGNPTDGGWARHATAGTVGAAMTDHCLSYVECDVPEGVTLREWRRAGAARARIAWWRRLLPLSPGRAASTAASAATTRAPRAGMPRTPHRSAA